MNALGINGWRDPEKVGGPSLEALLDAGYQECPKCQGLYEGQECGCEPQAHADGRWECMSFDTEAGHSCAHCGAKYRNGEPVEHEEDCPHERAP